MCWQFSFTRVQFSHFFHSFLALCNISNQINIGCLHNVVFAWRIPPPPPPPLPSYICIWLNPTDDIFSYFVVSPRKIHTCISNNNVDDDELNSTTRTNTKRSIHFAKQIYTSRPFSVGVCVFILNKKRISLRDFFLFKLLLYFNKLFLFLSRIC